MSLDEPLVAALAAFGLRAERVEVISPPNPAKRGRSLHRAHLEDGTSVKLRTFETAAVAAEQVDRRSSAPAPFAPAMGACGAVVLEAWVDGAPVPTPLDEVRSREAGRILGALHAEPRGDEEPSTSWLEVARTDLGILHGADRVDDDAAGAIEALLAAGDPGWFVPRLLHRDFCAANLVAGADGGLWVVDNEWFLPGPAAFDLGRTRNRWWMSADESRAFTAGYDAVAGPPADEGFWALVADLFGARVEMAMNPERGTPILDQLRGRIGRRG